MRNLASIQKVEWKKPIEGKDRIELIGVLGWQVIVKKDEFNIGDKLVYVEIDSILPEKPEFEFLRKNSFRIKTMKMAGVISQGICFRMEDVIVNYGNHRKIGTDVTDEIGIKKYEPDENNIEEHQYKIDKNKFKGRFFKFLFKFKIFRDIFLVKKDNKGFPVDVKKTDETRIQSLSKIMDDKTIPYVVTEKIEGSSGTYSLKIKKGLFNRIEYDYAICSRNNRLSDVGKMNGVYKDVSNSFIKISKKYDIENVLKKLHKEFIAIGLDLNRITIQGEVISPKIQGNIYKVKEEDFYVFNLIIHKKNGEERRYDYFNMKFLLEPYNLKLVPLVNPKYYLPNTIEELLDYANDKSKLYDTLREGIVLRNEDKKISFKAVSNEYLLKRGY